jgi:hypothetical protein
LRGNAGRVNFDVIAGAVPDVASACQEFVHLVRTRGFYAEFFSGELDESTVRVMRVEVDNAEDDILPVQRSLAEAKQMVVGDGVEAKRLVILERGVFLPDPVH